MDNDSLNVIGHLYLTGSGSIRRCGLVEEVCHFRVVFEVCFAQDSTHCDSPFPVVF